jgi:hypothetical protein
VLPIQQSPVQTPLAQTWFVAQAKPSALLGCVQPPEALQVSFVQVFPSSAQATPALPLLHVVVLVAGVQTWHGFDGFCAPLE